MSSGPFDTNLPVKSNAGALAPGHAALPHHPPAVGASLPRAFKTSPLLMDISAVNCISPTTPSGGCVPLSEQESLGDIIRLSRSRSETHLPPYCPLTPPKPHFTGVPGRHGSALWLAQGSHNTKQDPSSKQHSLLTLTRSQPPGSPPPQVIFGKKKKKKTQTLLGEKNPFA